MKKDNKHTENNKRQISRRDSLKYITLGTISVAYLAGCNTPEEIEDKIPKVKKNYPGISEEDIALMKQKFFTDHERETVRQLANLIIPADNRSGNAEDAGVVPFIEFMMLDKPENQTKMRGGLKWMDFESLSRYEKEFIKCSEEEQQQILDDIAYPDTARPEFSQGVSFFNIFRDYVATGFWSSKTGINDLPYEGNMANVWSGAPQEWLDRLSVSYDS